MLHPLTTVTAAPTVMPFPKPKKLTSTSPSSSSSATAFCKLSPSATLDILILILVLFSCAFLIVSYLTYLVQSLSQVLPALLLSSSAVFHKFTTAFYVLGFLIFALVSVVTVEICFSYRSRRCERPGCRGLKNAMEFDLKLETEEVLNAGQASKEIDCLPWKGGTAMNPDYKCLRSELRKMAPPNGRAILLFRAKCGCPVAKLEAWAAKRARRQKNGSERSEHVRLYEALSDLLVKGAGMKC